MPHPVISGRRRAAGGGRPRGVCTYALASLLDRIGMLTDRTRRNVKAIGKPRSRPPGRRAVASDLLTSRPGPRKSRVRSPPPARVGPSRSRPDRALSVGTPQPPIADTVGHAYRPADKGEVTTSPALSARLYRLYALTVSRCLHDRHIPYTWRRYHAPFGRELARDCPSRPLPAFALCVRAFSVHDTLSPFCLSSAAREGWLCVAVRASTS